ncbi:MAG: efflux RND transporter periplasmic adaptor subunit [Pseudomonadota bacterium]
MTDRWIGNGGMFALALALVACAESTEPPRTVLRPVKQLVVESGAAAIRNRVFSGTARSETEADLSFRVSGRVIELPVSVGEALNRGALIAALDPDTFRVELEQASAEQARTNAERRNAESEYQRVRQLYTNDNASRNELDTALANSESARAAHEAAVQSVRLARLNLDYTRLTLDADCSVAELAVEVNENVIASQTIAQVNCGEAWEVLLSVPESLIGSFRNGLGGTVRFPSVPEQQFAGKVSEVGIGTGTSRTFPVTVSLDQVPDGIRSNLAAEITFRFDDGGDAAKIHLPPAAVVEDEQGTYVYLIVATDEPGAAVLRRQSVAVGDISELGLEILSGVAAGDRVVTAGQINARDGMRVRDEPVTP